KITYRGLVMAGDNLILSNSDRQILVISPIDGKIIKKISLGQQIFHSPIIVNGKLYLHLLGRFNTSLLTIK
ncbi:MAG: hypothetical protein O3B09_01115, partial [Proteobacteria bacterium]|nr:hypothetical protein [Pseudomonadota bacterium]